MIKKNKTKNPKIKYQNTTDFKLLNPNTKNKIAPLKFIYFL